MDRPPIPDDVRRFILISIPSIPYLEAMLLLRRDSEHAWDARQLAQRIYVTEKAAQALLTALCEASVLAVADQDGQRYRYQPATEDLKQMIDRLASIYAKNLVDVTHLVHAKTDKKAQQFADAFLWKKDS